MPEFLDKKIYDQMVGLAGENDVYIPLLDDRKLLHLGTSMMPIGEISFFSRSCKDLGYVVNCILVVENYLVAPGAIYSSRHGMFLRNIDLLKRFLAKAHEEKTVCLENSGKGIELAPVLVNEKDKRTCAKYGVFGLFVATREEEDPTKEINKLGPIFAEAGIIPTSLIKDFALVPVVLPPPKAAVEDAPVDPLKSRTPVAGGALRPQTRTL